MKIELMPYRIEIQIPENDPQEIIMSESLSIGSDPSNDVCLQDFGLAPKHCIFRQQQGVLTVLNIGGSKPFKIGKQKLELGKMYILDHNDQIKFGDLTIVIDEFDPTSDEIELEEAPAKKNIFGTPASELAPDPDEEEDQQDESLQAASPAEPTSLSVEEIIARAKEASGEHNLKEIKKEKPKKAEPTHWDELNIGEQTKTQEGKTSSRLLQLTQKLKQILVSRPKRETAVKAEPIKKIVTHNPKVKFGKLENIPGFIPRFFAFAFNLTLTGLIVQTVFDIPKAVTIFSDLLDKTQELIALTPQIAFLKDVLQVFTPEVLASILVYFILEYFFSLLLGRSLGYTLMGIYENSGFITARIKALVRTTVALLTFPFIIFDAPAFFRRRTLKEVLSFSSLGFHQTFVSYLSALILLPALLLVFLLADAFNKKDLPLVWQYQEHQTTSKELKSYPLSFLGVNLIWEDDWNENILPSLMPNFLIENNPEKLKAQKVGLSLMTDNGAVSIYPGAQYSALEWFRIFNSRNWPVRVINPKWQEFIELSVGPGPVETEMKDQMRMLFLAGFTDYLADPLHLLEYVQVFGPLLPPIETWREQFMSKMHLNNGDQLRWVKNGNRDLMIIQRKNEDQIMIEHIFLDHTPFKSLILIGNDKVQNELIDISQKYIQQSRLLGRGMVGAQDVASFPFEMITLLSQWMDHLQENKLPLPKDSMNKLYQEFFHLAGEVLGLENAHPLKKQFDLEFGRLMTFLESTQVPEENLELKNKFQKLHEAYSQRQSSFFARDSYN